MMSYVLGVHGDLIENIPQLGLINIFHYHHPTTAESRREGMKEKSGSIRIKPLVLSPSEEKQSFLYNERSFSLENTA